MKIKVNRSWFPWGIPKVYIEIEETTPTDEIISIEGCRWEIKSAFYDCFEKGKGKVERSVPSNTI